MNKIIFTIGLMVTTVSARAFPYARFMDVHHPQQSMAFLIDPTGVQSTIMVTDLAIVTHSAADGSIMPKSCQATWCPPEDWTILELGAGGSAHLSSGHLSGDAVIHAGTSLNVAPQIGALLFMKVNANSPAVLVAVKNALMGTNGNGIRLGYGVAGNIVVNGVCQSAKEAFPGSGIADILKRNGRITAGYAWTY